MAFDMDFVRLYRLLNWLAVAAVAGYGSQPAAQTAQPVQPVPEYKLKAAFVYNFALFTDWPAGALDEGAALHVCVNADSALHPALAELNDKPIKGRRVVVDRLPGAADALRNCHVLYLDSLDRERWAQIKKSLGGASVLTVSDDADIGRSGAVITLYLANKHIAFDIDMNAARQARLALSSKLLRLARVVQ